MRYNIPFTRPSPTPDYGSLVATIPPRTQSQPSTAPYLCRPLSPSQSILSLAGPDRSRRMHQIKFDPL